MLAYYVEWHMEESWRPLLFDDEDLDAKETRDPVEPARRSDEALEKASRKTLKDGSPVHRFDSLLACLSTIVRNQCRPLEAELETTCEMTTLPTPLQRRALDLLKTIEIEM